MKKVALSFLVILMASSLTLAQTDLQPFAGWHFGGKWRFYEGDVKVKSNVSYGIALDHVVTYDVAVEVYYSKMSTTAEWRPAAPRYENLLPSAFKTDVHYFQLGAIKTVDTGGNIEPFGGLTVGATWFHNYDPTDDGLPGAQYSADVTLFSISLGGGVKVMLSDRVGIRLQGRLLMPMYFNGLGFFVGAGTGGASAGLGVSSTIPIVQGDLTGGLVFRLGGSE